jgi:hypothetical protein
MNPKKETPDEEWLAMHHAKTEKLINNIQKTFAEWKRAQSTPQHTTEQNQ